MARHLGGWPNGHINTNPDVAVQSAQYAIGLMVLPHGQRQAGKHVHGVTEIYVVLEGTVEGYDGTPEVHRAGPMDCTYTPAGCPHGVRNCGMDGVVLVWVHDGIERNDAATYHDDDHDFGDAPGMQLVRFSDLPPDWSGPGARDPGTMHWSVEWVRGSAGAPDSGHGYAARNARIAVSLTVLEPGRRVSAARFPTTQFYLVAKGEVILGGEDGAMVLTRLDGLNVPAGEVASLRNNGPGSLHLLYVDCPAA